MNDEVGEPERMKASFLSSGATTKADFNQRTKINLTSKLPNPSRAARFAYRYRQTRKRAMLLLE